VDQLDKKFSVLILAAGRGSRMGIVGKKNPKCLIKINKIALIERIINFFLKLNIIDINIVIGYQKNKIIKILKKNKINFIFNNKYNKYGSVYSWFIFKKFLKKKNLIIIHSDIIFNINTLKKIIFSNKKDLIGTVKKKKLRKKSFITLTNKKNILKKICFKYQIKEKSNYNEIICINKFSYKTMLLFFKFLKNKKDFSWKYKTWEFLISEFANNNKIFVKSVKDNQWFNINTRKDLVLTKNSYREKI